MLVKDLPCETEDARELFVVTDLPCETLLLRAIASKLRGEAVCSNAGYRQQRSSVLFIPNTDKLTRCWPAKGVLIPGNQR
ncbi:MAG: hypothetical protein EOM68_23415 [Spirochaetia bacterium]|nr:hypothetical protein [Spirochaetia bacterium]